MDIEDRVIVFLRDLAEGGKLRHTGIREHTIEPALLPLDLREEAIQIAQVRHVALDAGDISTDLFDRRRQLRLPAPRDADVRAFVHTLLRRGQANAARATGHEGNFPCQLPHVCLLHGVFSSLASMRPLVADHCLPSPQTARRRWPLSRERSARTSVSGSSEDSLPSTLGMGSK